MEIKGKIISFKDNEGMIRAEDGNDYYFNKLEIIDNETIEIGDIIVFKPVLYKIGKGLLYKATLISKEN